MITDPVSMRACICAASQVRLPRRLVLLEAVLIRTPESFCRGAWNVSRELRRGRRSEPGGQRVREPRVGEVSHPGNIAVWPNQHGSGSSDRAKYRKLPQADIFSICLLYNLRAHET
jgi:hypothetical protein